jgi:hypothetical protein
MNLKKERVQRESAALVSFDSVMISNPFNRIFKHSELTNNLFKLFFWIFSSFFKAFIQIATAEKTSASLFPLNPFAGLQFFFIHRKIHYLYANHQIKKTTQSIRVH